MFCAPKIPVEGNTVVGVLFYGREVFRSVMGFGCGVGLKWSIGPENSYSSLFLERSFGFWEEEVES